MSEKLVHLCATKECLLHANLWAVRWLTEDDYEALAEPFRRDMERGWTLEEFRHLQSLGYLYCGIMLGKRLCSIAGIWKRACDVWEVIAVATREEYRRRGMARSVVCFATEHILQHVKVASYTTGGSNTSSILTAQSAGFRYCTNIVNDDKWCVLIPRPPMTNVNCPLTIRRENHNHMPYSGMLPQS